MTELSVNEIRELARSIVAGKPGGIRYSALVREIADKSPETSGHRIKNSVYNLQTIFPDEVSKPSRGLFTPVGDSEDEAVVVGSTEQIAPTGAKIKEADFYQPFADWLKADLDEVTAVGSLGGAGLRSRWGTPDVRRVQTAGR